MSQDNDGPASTAERRVLQASVQGAAVMMVVSMALSLAGLRFHLDIKGWDCPEVIVRGLF